MSVPVFSSPASQLARLGLRLAHSLHYQLPPLQLIKHAVSRQEGVLNDTGALVIATGAFTGRSPKDRYIVHDKQTADHIHWNDFNQPIDELFFHRIFSAITARLNRMPAVYVRDCAVCADPRFRLNIRVITETASANLFAHNMFLRPTEAELESQSPDWQILSCPSLQLNSNHCGTRSSNAVVISFHHKVILIAGTGYTGEMKKSVFTVLNYLLPHEEGVLSMHGAANSGPNGDTALFFGLSGTGKTTLSADPDRRLIGDDEHGWTTNAIFNFEGGCYAKCIDLSQAKEPGIWHAIRSGALVENTTFFPGTNKINFSDGSITDNTRVSYPLTFIANALEPSIGAAPENIFFLTCDAYGILPPISRLSRGQAMYQFISGYTAKIAGTETGITEPKPTFSACFGAPFLPLHPGRYAALLGEKITRDGVKVWMINTGWTGGSYGTGTRINLAHTRAMITAALNGDLDNTRYTPHTVFGMGIPDSCPGVPQTLLDPRQTWSDPLAYDTMANELAHLFIKNFGKYASGVSEEILQGGPN